MFKRLRGVTLTRVGYMGGTAANPTYESVCSGKGGHSEALKVVFDPATISYEELLKVFFESHPYQRETKPQYMSAIFYQSEAQKASAEAKAARGVVVLDARRGRPA